MVAASSHGDLWMGVDLGTQSVRVMIADDTGGTLAFGTASLDSRRADGQRRRHEQDPSQWWEAVGLASRHAFAGLPAAATTRPVGGVAICSTSGTVLLTDERGAPQTIAVMYDDARAVDELASLRDQGAGVPGLAAVQVSWALPKISWLLRQHQLTSNKAAGSPPATHVAHSADAVAAALVGHRVATDSSHALKSGYDPVADRWNGALVDAAGIDARALPEVVRPGTRLGVVTAGAAAHTGIPAGTPVLAGMTDGCAAQIAAGALAPGSWNSVLGTTLVLKGVSDRLVVDPEGAVYSHRHPDRGWLPGGASNVGAAAIADEFGGDDLDHLGVAARRYEPAGSIVYPLTATGERFPFVRPDAERFELGSARGRADRYAAVLQGVAFVERLCFERLAALGAPVDGEITITGGGTRSDYWNQLRADVLGRPLTIPATPEPSFGMAVLASARGERVTERAGRMVSRRAVVSPRPGGPQRLSAAYERFVAELARRGYIGAGFTAEPIGSVT